MYTTDKLNLLQPIRSFAKFANIHVNLRKQVQQQQRQNQSYNEILTNGERRMFLLTICESVCCSYASYLQMTFGIV